MYFEIYDFFKGLPCSTKETGLIDETTYGDKRVHICYICQLLWNPLTVFLNFPMKQRCLCIHSATMLSLSAFSFHFHLPKSIYEGSFGCGYLKERRASGLVFCENTTSLYRALFVSSLVLFYINVF